MGTFKNWASHHESNEGIRTRFASSCWIIDSVFVVELVEFFASERTDFKLCLIK